MTTLPSLLVLALQLSPAPATPAAAVGVPSDGPVAEAPAKAKLTVKIKDEAGVETAHYIAESDGFKLKNSTGAELMRAHIRDGQLVVKDDMGKELVRVVKGEAGAFELQATAGVTDLRLTPIDTGWVLSDGKGVRKLEAKAKGAEMVISDAAGKRVGLVRVKGDHLKSEFGDVKRSTHASIPPGVMALFAVETLTWTERASLACALLGGLP